MCRWWAASFRGRSIVPGRSTQSLAMRKRAVPTDPHLILCQEEVRKLRSDLWMARRNLIELMPQPLEEMLTSYFSLKSREDVYRWWQDVVENVLTRATPKSWQEMKGASSISDRAYCPLCGGSSQNINGEMGFAYPEGLRRHLGGTFNARPCTVMEAAKQLARDHVDNIHG